MRMDDLVNQICSKWKTLLPSPVCFTYALPRHPKCMLDNDRDLLSLSMLAASIGLDRVDVFVSELSKYDNEYNEDNVDEFFEEGMVVVEYEAIDVMIDLLPQFCSHKEKFLFSSDLVNGISHVGQRFEGGASEFRNVLCKYSIEVGFEFVYVKNDKARITAECSHRKFQNCKWRVHASLEKSSGFFCIRSFFNENTCGATVCTSKSSRITSEIVADLMVDHI
eukprot:TRINITY_DN19243_c0_g2_i1.p1 TRINITY_DN19243_c0_g2~~TRINITY_DN19243_c0_g2_i1.p1  ORF type:complete len:222 (+),score=40.46 TRINITY_DN19243_c0_g2_i1:1903-2568(+)